MQVSLTFQFYSPYLSSSLAIDLSPDNERMIYSVMTSTVHMANIRDPAAPQHSISFSDHARDSLGWYDDFGIWSCRFSAGTSYYAIQAKQLQAQGHFRWKRNRCWWRWKDIWCVSHMPAFSCSSKIPKYMIFLPINAP